MYRAELQSVPDQSIQPQIYITIGGASHHVMPKQDSRFSELEQYIAQFWPDDANSEMMMQCFSNILETLQSTHQKDDADHTSTQTMQLGVDSAPQYVEYQNRFLTGLLPIKQKLVGALYTENDETSPITENGLSLLVIKLIQKRIITLLQFQELFRDHLDKLIITAHLTTALSSIEQHNTLDVENNEALEKIRDFFLNPDDYAQAGEIEHFKKLLREEIVNKIAAINQMRPEDKEAFNKKHSANLHSTKPINPLLTFRPQTLEEKTWCRYTKLDAILRRGAVSPTQLALLTREQLIILAIHPSLGSFVARKTISLDEFCQLTEWQIFVYANDNIVNLLNAGKLTHAQARNLTEQQFQMLASNVGILVCSDQFTLVEAYKLTRAETLCFTSESIIQLIITGIFSAKEILRLNDSQIRLLSHVPTFVEALVNGFISRENFFTLTVSSSEIFNFSQENILSLLENNKIDSKTVAKLTYYQCLVLCQPEIFILINMGIISVTEVLTNYVAAWMRNYPEQNNLEYDPKQKSIYILIHSKKISFKEFCELSELNYQKLILYPNIISLLRDNILSLDEFFKLNYAQLNLLSSRRIQDLIKKKILTKDQALSFSFTHIKCIQDEQIYPSIYNGFIDLSDPFFNNYISDAQYELLRDRAALIYLNSDAVTFLKRFKSFTLQTFLSLDKKQRQSLANSELQMLITSDLLPIAIFAQLTSEQITHLKTQQLFLLANRIPVAEFLENKTTALPAVKPLVLNLFSTKVIEICQEMNLDQTLCTIFLQALADYDHPLPPHFTDELIRQRIGLVAVGLCDPITALAISADELTSYTNECKLKPASPATMIIAQQTSTRVPNFSRLLPYHFSPPAAPPAAPSSPTAIEAPAHTETAATSDRYMSNGAYAMLSGYLANTNIYPTPSTYTPKADSAVDFVPGLSEMDELFPNPYSRFFSADTVPEGLPTQLPDDLLNKDEYSPPTEHPPVDYDGNPEKRTLVPYLKRPAHMVDDSAAEFSAGSSGNVVVTAPAASSLDDQFQSDVSSDPSPESTDEFSDMSGSEPSTTGSSSERSTKRPCTIPKNVGSLLTNHHFMRSVSIATDSLPSAPSPKL